MAWEQELMRHRPASLPLLSLLALAAALPAAADTVHLRNGRDYEGVIADRTAEGVRIRLAFGYIVIPDDQVLSIDKEASPLAEYLERKAALLASPDARAAEWLALARWAKSNDLAQGVREAAEIAAELDPGLPGLDPLLRPFGIVFEEKTGRWLPLAEVMARRGLVSFEGEWMTAADRRSLLAERERERAIAAQEATARRLAAVAAALAAREAAEARQYELAQQEPSGLEIGDWAEWDAWGLPFWGWGFAPGFVVPSHKGGHRHGNHGQGHGHRGHGGRGGHGTMPSDPLDPRPSPHHGLSAFVGRQPGSLLPPQPMPSAQRPSRPASAGVSSRSSAGNGG
jgi:hypothetical protein